MKKVIYYSNDQTDDFAELNIRQKQLPPDYPYFTKDPVLSSLLWAGAAFGVSVSKANLWGTDRRPKQAETLSEDRVFSLWESHPHRRRCLYPGPRRLPEKSVYRCQPGLRLHPRHPPHRGGSGRRSDPDDRFRHEKLSGCHSDPYRKGACRHDLS